MTYILTALIIIRFLIGVLFIWLSGFLTGLWLRGFSKAIDNVEI